MDSAIMISKYGEILPVIGRKYHPNPGPRHEGYSEIELCIDWLFRYDSQIKSDLDEWVKVKYVQLLDEYPGESFNIGDTEEVCEEIFYCDISDLCADSISSVQNAIRYFSDHTEERMREYLDDKDLLDSTDKIVDHLNQKYLRVRKGGKYDSDGEDAIYFRISSKGFDWRRIISEFLWDEFKDIKLMPKKVWIGHDMENNPPEVVLFYGTPQELLDDFDMKKFESLRSKDFNKDRRVLSDNKIYRLSQKSKRRYLKFI